MIAFACKCGKQYTLSDEFAGRKTTCTGCREPLEVPAPPASPSPRIAFCCHGCGMKFSVPGACAGRKTTCPTCKDALTVPAEEAPAYVPPPGHLDGMPSVLAKSGVEGGVTLAGDFATAERLSLQNLIDGQSKAGVRYVVESELARGGMGAVMRAVDCDIRREVAVKYLLDQSDTRKKLRFVEEAQITGQLEHPNIVPIHELGIDAHKRIFFSMKMVKGRSLADVLHGLRDGVRQTEKDYSQGRLLGIVVNVCNALAYAHARGVVHRDLKPANIMVGDFGEVYVMDWGLAKVLHRGLAETATGPVMAIPVARLAAPEPFDFTAPAPVATPVSPSQTTAPSSGAGKIVTSRDSDADLTQDGAVLGTPMYMPPEQAGGKIEEIDERSDVYSMGAILYEILTLLPPVSKEGGYWPILMRVTQGRIEPPDQRAPERARAGMISPELAAIAMKALAKRREDRYPTIEAFRRDIERFMEGRSVSAKHDTIREMGVKLVRRNKAVSITAAAAVLLLLIIFVRAWWTNRQARIAAEQAYASYQAEQDEKEKRTKLAVPAFIDAARQIAGDGRYDKALAQVDLALDYDPNNADARLLRGQILIARKDFGAGRAELEAYLKTQPKDEVTRELAQLCAGKTDDVTFYFKIADIFQRQNAVAFAIPFLHEASKQAAAREKLLVHYRKQIEKAWPGQSGFLTLAKDGAFEFSAGNPQQLASLQALRGIPLNRLAIANCSGIHDLAPLEGMPLERLNMAGCERVRDLSPLRGSPLTSLELAGCKRIEDFSPLKGTRLNALGLNSCIGVQQLDFLTDMPLRSLSLAGCRHVRDLGPLRGMPLTSLNLNGCSAVTDLSPLAQMPLVALALDGCAGVSNLTPLKGMPLTTLDLTGCVGIHDLSPLEGMKLTGAFYLAKSQVRNLSPLAGMKFTSLTLINCSGVVDLSPLKDMPLTSLNLDQCTGVSDLSALQGMALTGALSLRQCPVRDLTPLKGMKINKLDVSGNKQLTDLSPLIGMPLNYLDLSGTTVEGLSPIKGMMITHLYLADCKRIQDIAAVQGMPLFRLNVSGTAVSDLKPLMETTVKSLSIDRTKVRDLTLLKGMKLTYLTFYDTEVADLTPLEGMKLETITFAPKKITQGIDVLRKMPSLEYLSIDTETFAPAEFWKKYDAKHFHKK